MWNSGYGFDWNRHMQHMQAFQQALIKAQNKIERLELRTERLEEELRQVKEKKTIHVDTIEYKFDQLKVERLDGALHIGLSPGQTDAIEDFAVNQQMNASQAQSPFHQDMIYALQDELNSVLEQEGRDYLKQCCNRYQNDIDDVTCVMIIEDIQRQLPKRLEWYLSRYPHQANTADQLNEMKSEVMQKTKRDMFEAIEHYVKQGSQKGEQDGFQSSE